MIGRFKVQKAVDGLEEAVSNDFPKWDGTAVDFNDLDLTQLSGAPKIWTKNRVLIHGEGGNNEVLKKILLEKDLSQALEGVSFTKVDPEPVSISHSEIIFTHAVKVDDWILQWNGKDLKPILKMKTAFSGYSTRMHTRFVFHL